MSVKKASAALLMIMIALPAAAAEQTLVVDADRTSVNFTLGSTLHTVHGTMKLRSGEIRFDGASGTASGSVVIDATSAESGNTRRDKKMHQKVLESDRFPDIVFTPTGFEGPLPDAGKGMVVLSGTIAIHGVTKPARLEAAVDRSGSSVAADFGISIPYVAWGMEDPSVFVLRADKEVTVEVEVHGTLEAAN